MKIYNLEIRKNTGKEQYDELFCPRTSISNVLTGNDLSLEEELNNALNNIKNTITKSQTSYIVEQDNVSNIAINNPNYLFLDSEINIYYNGLLLVKNLHYELLSNRTINLLEFTANSQDEFIFIVFNKFKSNINLTYKTFPKDYKNALDSLLDSVNSYMNDVNIFKSTLVLYLKNLYVDIDMDDSFLQVSNAVYSKLTKREHVPENLGDLFAMSYHIHNISYNLGCLFGTQNNVQYYGNNLGILTFNYKERIETNANDIIITDKNNPILNNEVGEE